MPSTYTTNIGLEKIAIGEQDGTWGTTVNTNMDLIDETVNGVITVTLAATGSTGSPNALAITDGASSDGRNKYITFDDGGDLGGNAYVQLTPDNAEKVCIVTNSLTALRSIFIFQGTYSSSRDFELAAGETALLVFSGGGAAASTVSQLLLQTSIAGITGTKAEFDTACTDGNFAYSGGAFHDGFSDYVANEHLDWTTDLGATNLDPNNSANGVLALDAAEVTQLANIGATTISAGNWTAVSNLSGTNTGDQTITLTGDVTGSGTGSFATTIAANSVDLAEMAHGTQGDVLYYGASGTPTRLGAGTSGYYLKTQGAGANPVWADLTGAAIDWTSATADLDTTGSVTADTSVTTAQIAGVVAPNNEIAVNDNLVFTTNSDFQIQAGSGLLDAGTVGIRADAAGNSGGGMLLYASLHATKANYIEFYSPTSTVAAQYNASDAWDFQANNIATTGDITGGEFVTSNAGDLDLRVNNNTGTLRLGGGSSATTGSQLYIYGGSHATRANDLEFFGLFSLALHYDYSENLWDFQANQIVTTGEILPGGSSGPIWTTGAGTPESAVTAVVGSLYTRTDGGANTTLYVKESGTGNTGWVAK